jgi:hypothetical protein
MFLEVLSTGLLVPIVFYSFLINYHNNSLIRSLKELLQNEKAIEHEKVQEYVLNITKNLI